MQTFLEYYQKEIQPRLMAIDLFLKTQPQPYQPKTVARLLRLSATELTALLEQEQLAIITKGAFLHLMQIGSSPICHMFGREVARGLPRRYTAEDISYIYGLELSQVETAAKELGQERFVSEELSSLFAHIMIPKKQFWL